jgi:hypothetical protein
MSSQRKLPAATPSLRAHKGWWGGAWMSSAIMASMVGAVHRRLPVVQPLDM